MKIAICDDDKYQHQEIKKNCQKYCDSDTDYTYYFSGEELLEGIKNGDKIDILF